MSRIISFGTMESRLGCGVRAKGLKTNKRARRKAVSPKQLISEKLAGKPSVLFADDDEPNQAEWNTGQWRAIGGSGTKKRPTGGNSEDRVVGEEAPVILPVEATPRQFSKVMVFLLVAMICIAAGMAQVWVRLRIVRIGYELSIEAERLRRLESVHQKLSVEHALLRNPKRIGDLARNRLGLRSPTPEEVKRIGTGSGMFGSR